MSYTRRFSRTITVHYSGSVSYPASQTGGVKSYSGTKTETINVDIFVDTDPFDGEMHNMRNRVDLLTGSVVATKAAHVATISETSKQIGSTIVNGFFKTVKSDISQQIVELQTQTDALLLQLNQLAKRCNDKKRQMGVDYQGLATRYSKIFSDLNTELENRIHSIDEPVFRITRSSDAVASKTGGDDMISMVTVSSGEQAKVHSLISANLAKAQAANAIDKSRRFLAVQRDTDMILDKCLRQGGVQQTYTTPFCVVETVASPGVNDKQVVASPMLSQADKNALSAAIDAKGWNSRVSTDAKNAISVYFNSDVAKEMQNATNEHSRRVAELTARLFNLDDTAAPNKL